MGIIWKVAAAIVALLVIVGTIGALTGDDDESVPGQPRIVTVGDTTISIPAETTREELVPVLVTKMLTKSGYVQSYRSCVARFFADEYSAADVEAAPELSSRELQEEGLDVIARAAPKCAKSGEPILDPNATPEQLEVIRESFVNAVPLELPSPEFTSEQRACATEKAEQLSDDDLISIQNGSAAVGEEIYGDALAPCFS